MTGTTELRFLPSDIQRQRQGYIQLKNRARAMSRRVHLNQKTFRPVIENRIGRDLGEHATPSSSIISPRCYHTEPALKQACVSNHGLQISQVAKPFINEDDHDQSQEHTKKPVIHKSDQIKARVRKCIQERYLQQSQV